MNLPDFLTLEDYDEIRVTGTRIGLYHFVFDYNEGFSAEELAYRFSTVPLATVHKVIAFYLENRGVVDAYCAQYQADLDRMRATGRHVDLEELRARLRARQSAEVQAQARGEGGRPVEQGTVK